MAKAAAKKAVGRPKSEATEAIHVRLKPKQQARLDAIVDKKGTTRTAIVQIAVAEYLERQA